VADGHVPSFPAAAFSRAAFSTRLQGVSALLLLKTRLVFFQHIPEIFGLEKIFTLSVFSKCK